MFFDQTWTDHRLPSEFPGNVSGVHLRGKILDQLWIPDTIVLRCLSSRLPDVSERDQDQIMLVQPRGKVNYNIRLVPGHIPAVEESLDVPNLCTRGRRISYVRKSGTSG